MHKNQQKHFLSKNKCNLFLKILLFLFLWFQKWRLLVEALAGSGTQTISSEKDPKNPNPNPSPNPPIPQRQLAEPVTGFHWSKPSRLARSLSPETPSLSSGSGGLSESLWTLNPMLSLRSVETQRCSFFFVFPFFCYAVFGCWENEGKKKCEVWNFWELCVCCPLFGCQWKCLSESRNNLQFSEFWCI